MPSVSFFEAFFVFYHHQWLSFSLTTSDTGQPVAETRYRPYGEELEPLKSLS
jgi:hypothetical protein